MAKGRWITPDSSAPTERYCRRVLIPKDVSWLSIFFGCLDELRYSSNFEQLSGISPDEAAATFAAVFDGIEDCSMIGQVVAYASTNPPSGTLACDGATHLRTDYPDLYAALNSAYITDADHFRTPDLRGRGIIGSGTGPGLTNRAVAQSFGEETHQLTVPEMPSHTHTYSQPQAYLPTLTGPQPFSLAVSSLNFTGSAGGNGVHNNVQPSHVLSFAIYFE